MRYAKIKDGKVIDVITGVAPSDYVPVIKEWESPIDYPGPFYVQETKEPVVTVDGDVVSEHWVFELKSIPEIKSVIYQDLKKERYKMQLGSFESDGVTVTLIDRDDEKNIKNLSASSEAYKISDDNWIETTEKIALLKVDTSNYVQSAYDYELAQTKLVRAMATEDELKTYFESM